MTGPRGAGHGRDKLMQSQEDLCGKYDDVQEIAARAFEHQNVDIEQPRGLLHNV